MDAVSVIYSTSVDNSILKNAFHKEVFIKRLL
jgi:hypothetical protein